MAKNNNSQLLIAGLAAAATASLLYYLIFANASEKTDADAEAKAKAKAKALAMDAPGKATSPSAKSAAKKSEMAASPSSSGGKLDDKALHAKIEELDKKGKALFKNKQVRSMSYGLDHTCIFYTLTALVWYLTICFLFNISTNLM